METRHPDGPKRSRNRMKNVQFHTEFLKPRSFKVKVNEILSGTKIQTEAIPQGIVVSSKFFILKTNKIVPQLMKHNRF